ncbi:hypothetical protein Tco_0185358 [Tanacetum coccineum]
MAKLPRNVKVCEGSKDPEDYLGIFLAAAEQEEWPMPVWCKMFRQALSGAARNLFDDLDPKSVDSFEELSLNTYLGEINICVPIFSYELSILNSASNVVLEGNWVSHSAPTMARAYSQIYNGKSRHLDVRHSMVRELIRNGVIYIEFVRTQHNLADHLTKGLAKDLVIKSVIGMGLKSI